LIRDSTAMKTGAGGVTAQTDWTKALNTFEKMSPGDQAMQYGKSVGDVRQFLTTMATEQAKMATRSKWAKRIFGYEAIGETARGGITGLGKAAVRAGATVGKAAAVAAMPPTAVAGTMLGPRSGDYEAPQTTPPITPTTTPQTPSPALTGAAPTTSPLAQQPAQQQPKTTGDPLTTNVWQAFPGDEGLNRLADRITHMENPKNDPKARAARNHNPGNLKVPGSKDEFQVFDTEEQGRAALIRQLRSWSHAHPDWTINDLNEVYAPETSKGGDNPPGTTKTRNQSLMSAIAGGSR
jgi:hypothetical protein